MIFELSSASIVGTRIKEPLPILSYFTLDKIKVFKRTLKLPSARIKILDFLVCSLNNTFNSPIPLFVYGFSEFLESYSINFERIVNFAVSFSSPLLLSTCSFDNLATGSNLPPVSSSGTVSSFFSPLAHLLVLHYQMEMQMLVLSGQTS